MKLKKLGKTYYADSENNFSINKDVILSDEVLNYINIILDYFRKNGDVDIHSAYLRGSCLERNVIDIDTMDIDLVIVHENDLFKPFGYFSEECITDIIETMKSSYGFSVHPDVRIDHIDYFLEQNHLRFLSKKIYGEEDLSISKASKNDMITHFNENYDLFIRSCVKKVRKNKKLIDYGSIRSTIRYFFRAIITRSMVENGEFSRSLFKCYEESLKKYPYHSEEFDDILDLFLNMEEYSKEKIIKVLNQIILLLGSISSNKPYRIIVNMKTE